MEEGVGNKARWIVKNEIKTRRYNINVARLDGTRGGA